MFVSLKVAEIELVEVSSMVNEKREIRSDSRNTQVFFLSTSTSVKRKIWLVSFGDGSKKYPARLDEFKYDADRCGWFDIVTVCDDSCISQDFIDSHRQVIIIVALISRFFSFEVWEDPRGHGKNTLFKYSSHPNVLYWTVLG